MAGPVLGMCGFGCRDLDADHITVLAGSPAYETSILPTDSASTTALVDAGGDIRIPWHDMPNNTTFTPSTGAVWYHFRFRTSTTTNANTRYCGIGAAGTKYIAVSFENTTNKITIMVGTTVRATTASEALSINTWARFHVHLTGVIAGSSIHVYRDGDTTTPVLSYVLVGADATALAAAGDPDEFRITFGSSGSNYIDDLVAWDPAHADFQGISLFAECSIAERLPTGDGTETDWSGSFADVDERPFNDADKITATAVGDEFTFTKAAIGEDNVFAFQVKARVTRTGTDTGSNISVIIRNGGDSDFETMAAPGDGHILFIGNYAADGNPLSPVSWDASRVGVIAET